MAGTDIFGVSDDEEEEEEHEQGFMNKSVWRRMLIVAAGPVFNLILPIIVFTSLWMAGDPQPSAVVGSIDWGSPAAEAGLKPDDKILSIDDTKFRSWIDFIQYLDSVQAGEYNIRYQRDEQVIEKTINIQTKKPLGISYSRPSNSIGVDDPDSPAGKAGLKTFDRIVEDPDFTEKVKELQATKVPEGQNLELQFWFKEGGIHKPCGHGKGQI